MEQSFFDAVKAGNVDEVRCLVQGTLALAGTKDGNGVSAILVAPYHGRRDAAVALVELGAPVDIFEASALGLVDRITALIGADPALRWCQGSDPHFHQMVDWRRSSLSLSVAFSGFG